MATADKNPSPEIINLIENRGAECAAINEHLERMDWLKEDGILLRLNKFRYTCPMAPEVAGATLCHCTRGHEKVCRSRAFGKPAEVEIWKVGSGKAMTA